jgi:hypothetical protein
MMRPPTPMHERITVPTEALVSGDVLIFPLVSGPDRAPHSWEVWRSRPLQYPVGAHVQRRGHPEYSGVVSHHEEGSPVVRFARGVAVVPAAELEPASAPDARDASGCYCPGDCRGRRQAGAPCGCRGTHAGVGA